MTHSSNYRGRFAPSPTGLLHFGSLVAAVGSFLDAKHHHGIWLVRMEDLDTPRCVLGVADDILRTLEVFGLNSDEPVIYQSQRTAAYEDAMAKLQSRGVVYPCGCTRREIADSAVQGIEGYVYPGTCRSGMRPHPNPDVTTSHSTTPAHPQGAGRGCKADESATTTHSGQVAGYLPMGEGASAIRIPAWRVRTDRFPSPQRGEGLGERGGSFDDALQGLISQNLERDLGDFVVKRADGLFAYQLAVVVDDAAQGITHVVRGSDLLVSTPRQIWLQWLLGLTTPAYMHLPVAVNAAGEKLSKQTLAAPVDMAHPAETLWRVLAFLRQEPPTELAGDLPNLLSWAVQNWQPERLRGLKAMPALA
ncbi:Glutamyl-Q tRNA(Asp) synthetase [Ferriphaselus amnicola]|uniref:Glutamyl-Q tRNA(Asp) synthetase n=1 Tax=Ferriphaselus amnicola TaxID=1188319 RepID=A0A2Z6GA18_9PROT|nr:tRNA glutamyl-Q(34) synthetase GluQRS [Ferriphaselus amnicola]BBE50327.1 Glutamyl-Q tRNA(Asp) synthetase [Ferriphaselus amnicola]